MKDLTRAGEILPTIKSIGALKLITESLALEVEEARSAGALGFMARALVQATMPHRRLEDTRFVRTNGAFRLEMVALQSDIGLPYGTVPRLLMSWVSTEAVRTKSPVLILGDSLSAFMGELGMVATGGRWGSITRLRQQSLRLFNTAVSCRMLAGDRRPLHNVLIAEDYDEPWWKPRDPNQRHLFEATVVLSDGFFREVIESPVPIDLRALKAISKSPLAIDIYCWLTFRLSYLKKETTIPWVALQAQFGSDYGRVRDFKAAFLEQLKRVLTQYRDANVRESDSGLILKPSPPHIRRRIGG
jgi:Plasmid encoded RepA protein